MGVGVRVVFSRTSPLLPHGVPSSQPPTYGTSGSGVSVGSEGLGPVGATSLEGRGPVGRFKEEILLFVTPVGPSDPLLPVPSTSLGEGVGDDY